MNKVKHELHGQVLALQGKGSEAAQEVEFMGRRKQQEMCTLGAQASKAQQQAGGVAVVTPAGVGAEEKKEL